MSKKRGVNEDLVKFYLKAGGDSKGRYISVANSLMLDKHFQSLTPMARWMFFALCMEAGGEDSVSLSHKNAKKYGIKPTSYDAAIKQLIDKGFIRYADNLSKLETNKFVFMYVFRNTPPEEPGDETKRLLEFCKEAQAKRNAPEPSAPENSPESQQ